LEIIKESGCAPKRAELVLKVPTSCRAATRRCKANQCVSWFGFLLLSLRRLKLCSPAQHGSCHHSGQRAAWDRISQTGRRLFCCRGGSGGDDGGGGSALRHGRASNRNQYLCAPFIRAHPVYSWRVHRINFPGPF